MDSRNSTSLVYRTVKTFNAKGLCAIRQLKHCNTRCVSHARCHMHGPSFRLNQTGKSGRHCEPDGEFQYACCAGKPPESNYQS